MGFKLIGKENHQRYLSKGFQAQLDQVREAYSHDTILMADQYFSFDTTGQ